MRDHPPREKFVGVKLTSEELWRLRRAARRTASVSAFVRSAIHRAVAEIESQSKG